MVIKNNDWDAFAAANFIIRELAKSKAYDLTNLKLQKLLYFAYGIHLSLHEGKKLFESKIEAWKLGPVIPAVYHQFKVCQDQIIPNSLRAVQALDESAISEVPEFSKLYEEDVLKIKSLLMACIGYGHKKAWDLVDMTHHNRHSAWKKCFEDNRKNILIADADIKAEFDNYIGILAEVILKN